MNKKIFVTVNGKREASVAGLTLSEILRGEKPCGGHGRCGKCKVKARGALSPFTDAEKTLLSAEELARGVRLSCLTRALGDCEIETADSAKGERIVTDGVLPAFAIRPAFAGYGVAIDVGTTTLAARLYDTAGNLLAEASRLNPQQVWGADVISRIEAALSGKARELSKAIRSALNGIITELTDIANIPTNTVDGVVITGNTVMLSLLTGENVEPFSHAPFGAKRLFGEFVSAASLELSNLQADTQVYFPPCISAFVGADAICAILATRLCDGDTAMLADIGTNGEIAMWHNGKLFVCATAAGPAFEGVGISMGMRGAEGAIDKVTVENDVLKAHVIGGSVPVGICGSGLVDAVACMLDLELLDESGYLEEDKFLIQASVYLTPKDIRMLQLAKSAICAGVVTLIKRMGADASDVATLFIAGGFGNYLDRESAARIGLIPRALTEKTQAVGNAALGGAVMLLLNQEACEKAEALARSAVVVDLSTDPVFSEQYMSGMMLDEV
ncbi:MAG: DUF4445 domain-containing protein [Clostridia bacterium]|nr:DUF4445 domain-containing protein [Clostridia bacterium]